MLATLLLFLVMPTSRVLVWIVIAAFFAVALYPVVSWLERRVGVGQALAGDAGGLPLVLLVIAGLVTVFVVPLVREGTQFGGPAPADRRRRARRSRPGRRPARAVHMLQYVAEPLRADPRVRLRPGAPAGVLRGVATGVAGIVTIFVLAYLMVLEGPKVVNGILGLIDPRPAERIRRVGARLRQDRHRLHLRQPADQRHLRGADLRRPEDHRRPVRRPDRAVRGHGRPDPAGRRHARRGGRLLAGFVHSVTAGIVVIIFFVAYQQLENHLLQPVILARTVKLNPLTVLVAILVAVELAGILGALLAIPVAGMIQVIARDLWDHRRGGPTWIRRVTPADTT